MKYHFGLKLGRRKEGHKLTRENYAVSNNKTSLFNNYMMDYFFIDDKYIKMPREWTVRYFAKMIDYLNSIPKEKKDRDIKSRVKFIENKLSKYYNIHDDYRVILDRTSNLNDQLKDISKFENISHGDLDLIRMFDWEYDITGKHYTKEWCIQQEKDVMKNYDLNIEFFNSLDRIEFNKQISRFLKKNPQFKKVSDLNPYNESSGYYVLIVDEYKQLYVGTSEKIGKRVRQHWNNRKQFDRLLFPMGAIDNSIIPFDSFRALDITRIFVYETNRVFVKEDKFIKKFDARFVANRMAGGIPQGLLHAITMMKSRDLK